MYKSKDGGQNWLRIDQALGKGHIFDLLIDPRDQTLFARFTPIASKQEGIYRSTDGGMTWTLINANLEARLLSNMALSVQEDNLFLYVATHEGLFRSEW